MMAMTTLCIFCTTSNSKLEATNDAVYTVSDETGYVPQVIREMWV
jgi:hypothetical protein